ncbi:right-handed parallel beta-helix repeat-containing protein, partial [Patescibacteria group bacterium]|nr:right-handed parallel beta-helix repeat-containing protein [Patescibacteria group bacterium]
AIDKAGNESEPGQVSTIISLPKTIIINEIAWMGTKANLSDEWLELFNPGGIDVDIANWSIYGADTDQCLNFSDADGIGNTIIPATGYLIYANHEDDVRDNSGSNIVDIWDATIGMNNNSPGQIILYNAKDCQGAIIDAVNQVDSAWLGGDSGNRVTMERIDFESSGSDINNWADNNLITKNGMDAEGNPIDGTPKAENSVSKSSTEITGTIDFPVLTYLGSPYIVRWTLAVPQEKTLTVEPGVVIKFKDGYSGMEVDGTLKAIGGEADDEKIIFTSWSSNPQPGSWKQIYFSPESAGSELENVIIRYGGNFPSSDASCPWQMAAIRVDQASITLKNSLLEHNKSKGLYLIGSPSTTLIDNVQFSDNIPCQGYFGKYYGTGILIENGSPVVKNSTFKGNIFGIEIRNGASPEIKNNIFEENEKPIYVNNSYPCFSGNQSINNSLNGILVSNSNLTQSDVWQADLPYIIDGTLGISQDTILVLEPGVVIEFKNGQSGITVRGTLKAIGAPDEKIIFTSWSSDPQPGSWKQIYFTETAGADSELSNVIIEYGGNFPSSSASCHWQMAAVFVDKSSIILKNSIVNHNKSKGIYLMNSSSVIDNVQFSNNVPCQGYFGEYYGAGVLIQSGDSIIKNSTFKSNKYGIYIQSGASLLENLTFGEKDEKNNIDIYPIP